ncbi:MAG: CDP-diacylglycerol--glycerol-3-phosphate 3-phosphatidyltransferase [Alphaproteobacteria bacterium]|nr:CDP-diacylglycerol--glycerol-3-phosphate 3-phosphatidyltransferase [Alphaproteobacteria bacterium]
MKFFVNFLSAFRIAASFAIIPTMFSGWYITTFVLFVLAALSDFFDGFLARKYNVCTKLGGVMDHIGDKLLVVNAFILLCILLRTPYVIVPIIIMIARELYVSGLREFLGTQKIEMPVPKKRFSMGKIKTTLQMFSICAFLLWPLLLYFSEFNSKFLYYTIYVLPAIALLGLWLALVASIWSATEYTIEFVKKLKKIK